MDTTIIVFKALAGAGFAVVAVVLAFFLMAYAVFAARVVVNGIRAWIMRRQIKSVHFWIGRSGI